MWMRTDSFYLSLQRRGLLTRKESGGDVEMRAFSGVDGKEGGREKAEAGADTTPFLVH